MNTFNYLLGFGGYSQKVMITFKKDGELDPIAVQKAIGEAGFVREDWHPTIEEYAEFLCRYVAKQCGCQYSCAWSDFATDLHIAWADIEASCEGCPAKPYCPNYEDGGEDVEEDDCCEGDGCENCDADCDDCPCGGCEENEDEVIVTAFFRTREGSVAVNMTCYGEGLDVPAITAVLSNTAEAITKAGLALSVDTYIAAVAEAIENKCSCEVIAEYADIAMLLDHMD